MLIMLSLSSQVPVKHVFDVAKTPVIVPPIATPQAASRSFQRLTLVDIDCMINGRRHFCLQSHGLGSEEHRAGDQCKAGDKRSREHRLMTCFEA